MELENIIKNAHKDDASFKLLYDQTIGKVFQFLLVRTKSRQVALDITQEVYMSLWQNLSRFSYVDDAHFYGYIFTIARRKLFRNFFKIKRTVSIDESYDIEAPSEEREDYRKLLREVDSLNEKQRSVISLRYFSDFSFTQIANTLSITENNAKVLHHRAIEKLKKKISWKTD